MTKTIITKKNCLYCGKEISSYKGRKFCSDKCNGAFQSRKRKIEINNRCIDCGKLIDRKSIRCVNCFSKGNLNGHYKGIENYCIDCGKKIFRKTKNKDTKRCRSCSHSGERHYLFIKDKIRKYGIEFNDRLKNQIRQRDGFRCQECFRHQDELFNKSGKSYKLNIHHIDFDKKNNNTNNLISLCMNCHFKTNHRREDWINYYRGKVKCLI